MPILPQEMVTRIGRAHLEGQRLLVAAGVDAREPLEVALAVEAHRWFWKPDRVRTLLLADTRRMTTAHELAQTIKSQWMKVDGCCAPNSFVRSVYCLGYGEPQIAPHLAPEANRGLGCPWDLFGELAETGRTPDRKEGLMPRLEWKVKTLMGLRSRGIWMMDVSLHGRASGDEELDSLGPDFYRAWWNGYGEWVHSYEGRPEVVAVGKGLHQDLLDAGIPVQEWLYLPSVLRRPEQQEHQTQAVRRILHLRPTHGKTMRGPAQLDWPPSRPWPNFAEGAAIPESQSCCRAFAP